MIVKIKPFYIIFFLVCYSPYAVSQDNEELKITTEKVATKKERKIVPYEPLAPARAAFYSAVLPGLGQAYTKKYWKIPIVYAAMGAGVYYYVDSSNKYNQFRDAYKRRIAGFTDDEFYGTVDVNGNVSGGFSDDQLISLQKRYRREQELSLLITAGLYILNIIDANVTAHLQQYNMSEDLSFEPKIDLNAFNSKLNYGLSLNYSF